MSSPPDPERPRPRVRALAADTGRGALKIFLGYSSGVGKSFRMLDEGRRRLQRGQDVVVGAVQPRTEGEAAAVLAGLEQIPMGLEENVPVMDVEAVLQRRPEFCLVDGLACDNPPSRFWPHRWQEIEALLQAGISVVTSVNLQFIEECREPVARITGRRVRETVPQAFLRRADEIELVDAPPEHLGAGAGAPAPEARRRRLSELRELALLLAAEVVDHQLERYLSRHGIAPPAGAQERILACLIPEVSAATLMANAQRNAQRFRGELIAATVRGAGSPPDRRLEANLALARAAGAQVATLEGDDFVDTILPFAHRRGVTQIFVSHSVHVSWWKRLAGSNLERLIAGAHGMDVRIFPH